MCIIKYWFLKLYKYIINDKSFYIFRVQLTINYCVIVFLSQRIFINEIT